MVRQHHAKIHGVAVSATSTANATADYHVTTFANSLNSIKFENSLKNKKKFRTARWPVATASPDRK